MGAAVEQGSVSRVEACGLERHVCTGAHPHALLHSPRLGFGRAGGGAGLVRAHAGVRPSGEGHLVCVVSTVEGDVAVLSALQEEMLQHH